MNTNPQIIPLQPDTPAAAAPPASQSRFQFPALEPWPEPVDVNGRSAVINSAVFLPN